MLTDTILETDLWDDTGLTELAERAARAVLQHLGLDDPAFEIAVLGCDDARIATLNAEFRAKPTPTNVLSWPSEDLAPDVAGDVPFAPEPGELGDIAIAFETCAREAAAADKPLAAHVIHLIVHATLHLLGYDHETDADATRMESLETEILKGMEEPDPYA
ncbi:rRNA maturation RNase YbeY [Roseobacteraceae bacterium S113]